MTRESTKNLADCEKSDHTIQNYSGDLESAGVMIFGFLEEADKSSGTSWTSGNSDSYGDHVVEMEEEDDDISTCNAEKNRTIWESQAQLLQATLCRSSSLESKIRQATKETIREIHLADKTCVCNRPVADCRNCLQKEIFIRLQNEKYNCAICKSKWLSTRGIPSGEHTYIEVVDSSDINRRDIRVVIELTFRAEFEMPKAGEDYFQLTNRLPEVFIGKIERLQTVIKILCSASKKCMKERKMHTAPWRKQKYMQAKWAGIRELNATAPFLPSGGHIQGRARPKQRASMLSFDLLETLPAFHCPATEVV